MHVARLDHFVLTVADINSTIRFYTEVLGMQAQTFGGELEARPACPPQREPDQRSDGEQDEQHGQQDPRRAPPCLGDGKGLHREIFLDFLGSGEPKAIRQRELELSAAGKVTRRLLPRLRAGLQAACAVVGVVVE